jgi:hemoglobin-like flavoprotein
MRARRLIENSTYDPKTLRVLFQAFDEAWCEIADHFNNEPKEIEQARLRLAHAVLIVAREDSEDPERLKNDALQVMALAYRHREKVLENHYRS